MESDDEVKGSKNSLDFGARIYDPRLGRWASVDPLQQEYSNLSPYNFVANTPIQAIDPDGKRIVIISNDKNYRDAVYKTLIKLASTEDGYAVVAEMIASNDNFIISEGPNKLRDVITDKDGTKNFYILFDPYDTEPFEETGLRRSAQSSLAHEIGHCMFACENGGDSFYNSEMIVDPNNPTQTDAEGDEYPYQVSSDEIDANHFENIIRSALGMEIRPDYLGIPTQDVVIKKDGEFDVDGGTLKSSYVTPSNTKFDYSKVSKAKVDGLKLLKSSIYLFFHAKKKNTL